MDLMEGGMNLLIHAECKGTEAVQVYEGDDFGAAQAFAAGLTNVTVIQCNLNKTLANGESRALARKEKGEAAESLLSDIKAWLDENA